MSAVAPQAVASPTTAEIANLIESLRAQLRSAYGSDYSFVVLGRGECLGASTASHGVLVAVAAS